MPERRSRLVNIPPDAAICLLVADARAPFLLASNCWL